MMRDPSKATAPSSITVLVLTGTTYPCSIKVQLMMVSTAEAIRSFVDGRRDDRRHALVSAGGAQHEVVTIFGSDDLQSSRQSTGREAAGHRSGGLLCQVEGEAERRPRRPIRLILARRRDMVRREGRDGQGRRQQEIEPAMELCHMQAERRALVHRVEIL